MINNYCLILTAIYFIISSGVGVEMRVDGECHDLLCKIRVM